MGVTPASHWIGFHLALLLLLAIELLYTRRSSTARPEQKAHRTALFASVLWITAALAFSVFIYLTLGTTRGTEYLAGYAIEEALSVDNLFVFLLLFRVFRIEPASQPRVLFWGVAGAILMRGAFIGAGIRLISRFHWIGYVFGVILLAAAVRLLLPQKPSRQGSPPPGIRWLSRIHPVSLRQDRFFTKELGRPMVTTLFLALVAIELSDIVFALDSIPAVLSITHHPFIAYTSNIMAVMGLRSLYFLLAHLLDRLRFLHFGLALVLIFAAFKMLAASWISIGPFTSLAIIIVLLGATLAASLSSSSPARPS